MQVSLEHPGSVCPNSGGDRKELTPQAIPPKGVWGRESSPLPSQTQTEMGANSRFWGEVLAQLSGEFISLAGVLLLLLVGIVWEFGFFLFFF